MQNAKRPAGADLFAVHETGSAYLPPGCVTPFTLRVYVA